MGGEEFARQPIRRHGSSRSSSPSAHSLFRARVPGRTAVGHSVEVEAVEGSTADRRLTEPVVMTRPTMKVIRYRSGSRGLLAHRPATSELSIAGVMLPLGP